MTLRKISFDNSFRYMAQSEQYQSISRERERERERERAREREREREREKERDSRPNMTKNSKQNKNISPKITKVLKNITTARFRKRK